MSIEKTVEFNKIKFHAKIHRGVWVGRWGRRVRAAWILRRLYTFHRNCFLCQEHKTYQGKGRKKWNGARVQQAGKRYEKVVKCENVFVHQLIISFICICNSNIIVARHKKPFSTIYPLPCFFSPCWYVCILYVFVFISSHTYEQQRRNKIVFAKTTYVFVVCIKAQSQLSLILVFMSLSVEVRSRRSSTENIFYVNEYIYRNAFFKRHRERQRGMWKE